MGSVKDQPETWGIDEDQLKFSKQHGVIEDVDIRLTHERKVAQGRRRVTDNRLLESLSHEQKGALMILRYAWEIFVTGKGYKKQSFDRIDRGLPTAETEVRHGLLVNSYNDWHELCTKRGFNPIFALDVIGSGINLLESAQLRQISRYMIRKNFIDCLNVYCEMRGWDTVDNFQE